MNQSEFRAALLDPERPLPAGITDPEGRPAPKRFNVYRNNVTASLTEALRKAFPVVHALVGAEFFADMARVHLRAHPPKSPLLMFYGEDMPAFLEGFDPVRHLGYLPDVARLELAIRHSYHAADACPMRRELFASISPDRLMSARVRFTPPTRLLRSRWPIRSIWAANVLGENPPKAAAAEDVLIVRPEFDPEPVLLPNGAGDFIAALMEGAQLSEALDRAPEMDLTAALTILVGRRVIAEIAAGDAT
ncbi:DNA-binding domain-containing protein [Defluviimonas sp. WL0002]|uniref:DNA-binding domain-containing protein n=1 Tax=Albidovulum marisflavi TaxID=2984159 RepID=A0ABT2ZAM7_9RHOB|nr:DNA-binding domain-containing protein [Defluviimonas sp. WL0002]MCV2868200.1 DNA-binding domain-containing protein [Defluviimonas sp. WL0002]